MIRTTYVKLDKFPAVVVNL